MALTLRFFTTIAAITFALATNAQLVDKKSLTLDAAQKIAAASLAEARANNLNLVIAIVDDGGREGRNRCHWNDPRRTDRGDEFSSSRCRTEMR